MAKMMLKCENYKENTKILNKNARKSKFRKTCLSKYGCHGNVKLLIPKIVMSCQAAARKILGLRFAKFGGICFIIKKVINVRSQFPPSSPRPPPGDRIGLKRFCRGF